MWILESDRQLLTEILLGSGYDVCERVYEERQLPTKPIRKDGFYLLWESDPRAVSKLPSVVVVANGHLRDFMAWAITYFSSYKPFTAFFRVIEFDTLPDLTYIGPPSLQGVEAACVGVIVSEASLLSVTYGRSNTLTLSSCSGLLSHALTRTLALGATLPRIERVKENCLRARKAADYSLFPDVANAVDQIFHILYGLKARISGESLHLSPDLFSPLADACWQIVHDGRISDMLWNEITTGVEDLMDAHHHMEGTREERVLYFQRVASGSIIRVPKPILSNFIFGYLASLIGPGSLSHIDLVLKYASSFPTASLWYGLCAGLHKKSEVLVSFNVLGRRLLRDLLRQEAFLSPPTCDIALSELQILLDVGAESLHFPCLSPNRILVEIDPSVSILLNWTKRGEGSQGIMQTALLPTQKDSAQLLKELESHLQSALEIQKELFGRSERSPRPYDKIPTKQRGKRYKP